MIDIKILRENSDKIKESLKARGMDFDVDSLLKLDERRRVKINQVDELRAKHNEITESVSRLAGDEREAKIAESKQAKDQISAVEKELISLEEEFYVLFNQIPNLPLESVPSGKSPADNKVLKEWGEKPKFNFKPKDHLELGVNLDILDFESGAKVSGSGFYFLKNEGVLMELALARYALDFLAKQGFSIWLTPDVARDRFYLGTGYLPKGPEAQTYEIKNSDLGLIATAEVTLAGIHSDSIIPEDKLPLLYSGYSHCFRQEAGGYGQYSKGLYRVHQFTKVEMFAYSKPEESFEIHERFLQLEEELWQGLDIPYRVVEMCVADLGAQAAKKIDLEAWMPGRSDVGDWGEITSTTNATDYQARNLNVRYRDKEGKVDFVHMLNGTAIATSRAIIAILENYQQKDGSIKMPKVLHKYLNFKEIKPQ
jgi:seryl-tRNA synthetase